jgi:peptidoglycan/LPS O-acetylase OafA/YrhL
MNTIYVRPFPRLGAFLVGLVFGLLYLEVSRKQQVKESQAYEFENGFGDRFEAKFKRLVNDEVFIYLFYPLAAVILAWIIVGPFYLDYYGENSLNPGIKAIWLAFQRPAFATVVGFLMVLMALGHLPIFSWFLSMRVFQYFSKISYCFYMIHCMVFGALFMNGSELIDGNFETWFELSFHVLKYSTFIAFVLEVLVQMPFVGLAAKLFR